MIPMSSGTRSAGSVSTAPVFTGANVAPAGDGTDNNKLYLVHSKNVESPGGNYELGWTIEVFFLSTYYTLDATKYTITRHGSNLNQLVVELTGTTKTFQRSHGIRVSYDAAVGDIRSVTGAVDLATFTNNQNYTNTSSVDLLDERKTAYALNEASGTRSGLGPTLTDNNTVTSRAGKFSNAASFDDANFEYLSAANAADFRIGTENWECYFAIYLDDKTADYAIVSKDNVSGSQREYIIFYYSTADRFRLSMSSNGSSNYTQHADTFGSPSATTWYLGRIWHDADNDLIGVGIWDNSGTPQWDEDTEVFATGGVFEGSADFNIGASNQGLANYLDGGVDIIYTRNKISTTAEKNDWANSNNGKTYPFIPDYV